MLRRLLETACACAIVGITAELAAQTPTPPTTPPPTAPAPRSAPRRAITYTVTVAVTDGTGAPVHGAKIAAVGPVNREGETIADGTLRFTGLKAGSYRLRVEHAGFVTLERDITVRATAQRQVFDVQLSEAPALPEPEKPTVAPAAVQTNAPAGEPRSVNVADFIEKNFIGGKEPRKEDQLGCTASARTTLLQLRDPTKEETNPNADEVLYVVAGEGTLRLGNTDVPLSSSAVAVVPRGTVKAISRKGRNPLILLSVVSGPSCTGGRGQ
jgi:mannose-6-phosphate isomerase-like protein (cupin superfamily)